MAVNLKRELNDMKTLDESALDHAKKANDKELIDYYDGRLSVIDEILALLEQ
jgi:hypothetical protein